MCQYDSIHGQFTQKHPLMGAEHLLSLLLFLQLGQGGSSGSVETQRYAGDKEGACVAGKGKAEHSKRVPGASCACGRPQDPRGPGLCQAELPGPACSNFSIIINWNTRQ